MNTARRWYIYLVCAISLQSVTWAVIALLRNLLADGNGEVAFIAFQIAVVVIALPIFIVHWLWAQRLAKADANEREAGLRGIYHYGMMAGFLGPVVANTFSLVSYILWIMTGKPSYGEFSILSGILYSLIAMIVCGLLWYYQMLVVSEDMKPGGEQESFATMRRLYMFVFSAWGLTMTTMAIIHVIRWILFQFDNEGTILGGGAGYLPDEVARLIVGLALWLIFWRQAQSLFSGSNEAEHESALRKFYLYTTVFVAALSAVSYATIILAGFFRRILDLRSEGDIRTLLPVIVGMILLWAYHVLVLKEDAAHSVESARQGGVRRLYLYLIAAVGLAAFLVGLSGDLSTLIRSFSQPFGESMKEGLAWFTAALLAGLPVWLLPWRNAQTEAVALTPQGSEARRSTVRKIYLYFFLFLATMTVLSGAVYILYRLLLITLGEPAKGNLISGIAQAIAYSLVGVGVWLYHGYALRGDGTSSRSERALRLKDVPVVVLAEDANFGQSLLKQLQRDEPDLSFDMLALPAKDEETKQAMINKLNAAGVIVGPWYMAVETGVVDANIVQAVVRSAARKILIPVYRQGWEWAGVDRWNSEALIQQTVHAVKQWMDGDEVKASRPMTIGGIIGTVLGILVLLILLAIPILIFFEM